MIDGQLLEFHAERVRGQQESPVAGVGAELRAGDGEVYPTTEPQAACGDAFLSGEFMLIFSCFSSCSRSRRSSLDSCSTLREMGGVSRAAWVWARPRIGEVGALQLPDMCL